MTAGPRMAWGLLLLAVALMPSPTAAPLRQSDTAAAIVSKARAWLGGKAKLDQVHALEVVRETEAIRFLLPDRYQIETKTSHGAMIASFDGERIWVRSPKGMPPVPESDRPEIKKRGLRNTAVYALTYLLRTVPTYPMKPAKVVDSALCAGISTLCVEFAPPSGSSIWMAFDAGQGRPLAVVQALSNPRGFGIQELSDYVTVDGIKFPRVLADRQQDAATGRIQTLARWRATAVRVNPPLTRADFVKK